MENRKVVCPDCDEGGINLNRRDFLRTAGVTTAAAAAGLWAVPRAAAAEATRTSAAETAVKALYDTLTPKQKETVCFAWDHVDKQRGLLRTFVSNNWQITKPHIRSDFYTADQQKIVYDIFKGLVNPEWEKKFVKQLKDDTEGKPWGAEQSLAIFGDPKSGKFEFVMTGRHMTLRADGNSEGHVAFGGPIFHGHAASGFNEQVHHPGNVFWHQAEAANKLYQMLSGKQQQQALVKGKLPPESAVAFRGPTGYPGVPASELSADQRKELERVLLLLLEPYRKEDQDEARACLKKQGGLEKCSLAFYQDGDLGNDKEWDNWRVEGPAFVWYFRGFPHVHIWINVADDPAVKLNARG